MLALSLIVFISFSLARLLALSLPRLVAPPPQRRLLLLLLQATPPPPPPLLGASSSSFPAAPPPPPSNAASSSSSSSRGTSSSSKQRRLLLLLFSAATPPPPLLGASSSSSQRQLLLLLFSARGTSSSSSQWHLLLLPASLASKVKESFGIGKEQASGPSRASADHVADEKGGSKASSTEDKHQHSGASDTAETLFGKFRSKVSSSNVSSVLNRFKEAKFVDMAKRGYEIVKDELNGSQSRKKHLGFDPSSIPRVERSATSDIAIVPTKQSPWSKKWEAFKMKMQGNPLFKRISGISEPVKIKGEEIIDDMKERWENSDSPIVHKIQDINENIFQETNAAASIKEIHARDPSFSLPDFVEEVQNAVKPVLNAYMKGDIETLKKYCANEVIERCKAERQAYQSHDIFFDNKILHISDVQVVETKLIGESPVIIVRFQTQQIYCVRDKNGAITDGSQDTIQTVIYGWAMQPWDPEELPEGALFPIWRVREIQQFRMLSLI
ncbi:hypothetical protein ACLB2K_010751 [Fragaria x ananassa]